MTKPRTKLWTRDEARFIQNSGLLDDGQYELIEGELLLKMPETGLRELLEHFLCVLKIPLP